MRRVLCQSQTMICVQSSSIIHHFFLITASGHKVVDAAAATKDSRGLCMWSAKSAQQSALAHTPVAPSYAQMLRKPPSS